MKKIAFLYLDKTYIVYHSISIAIELAKSSSNEVHILCSERNFSLVSEILEQFNCNNIVIKILKPHWYINIPYYFETKAQLRKSVFYKYRQELKSYHAFVCSVYTDLFLKKLLKKSNKIKYIYTKHGIPNRAYSFDNTITNFDLFFIWGEAELRTRKKLNQLTPHNHAITSYFKYELVQQLPQKKIFNNNKPVILYNPHWEQQFSSFNKFGETILSFFKENPNYNLIFTPHSRLLSRKWWHWFKIFKYKECKNIVIDAGSELSNNMSYTNYANLYIGDISSQALEFIFAKEKPCLFLDAHHLSNDKINRPLSWDLGTVVSEITSLEQTIKLTLNNHSKIYKHKQIKRKQEMFHSSQQSPSFLAAKAIHKLLDES